MITVEHGNFNALIEITDASKGNLSIQLKKLNEAKLINSSLNWFDKTILVGAKLDKPSEMMAFLYIIIHYR